MEFYCNLYRKYCTVSCIIIDMRVYICKVDFEMIACMYIYVYHSYPNAFDYASYCM